MDFMSSVSLYDYQIEALKKMKLGCILNGTLGSGKSRTGLAFYYELYGGKVNTPEYVQMNQPADLYIITTARKRDTNDWEGELVPFHMSPDPKLNLYKNKVVIDSWNNIHRYLDVQNAFFIFDEQRVVGYGKWTHCFLKIASKNRWILLSATPGDTWMDYIPVFIANGFYKNKTDFINKHVIYNSFVKYPQVRKYINEGRLLKLRNHILVRMDFERKTVPHHETIIVNYNINEYDFVVSRRWNIFEEQPIMNANEYCSVLRKIVNTSDSRKLAILDLLEKHNKVIIFYTYDYELELLKELLCNICIVKEWNGHKHEDVPIGDKWAYLVQYTAGAEGWNCTTTDTIIFYSQSYSYKLMKQAGGRIDRLTTPFIDLYYYHIMSNAKIDKAINNTLKRKKTFSEKDFAPDFSQEQPKEDPDWLSECEMHSSWENPLE